MGAFGLGLMSYQVGGQLVAAGGARMALALLITIFAIGYFYRSISDLPSKRTERALYLSVALGLVAAAFMLW